MLPTLDMTVADRLTHFFFRAATTIGHGMQRSD